MGDVTEFANKVQSTAMAPSLTEQVWQPIPSNTKEFVVSAANTAITAGTVHRMKEMVSNFQQGTINQEQPVTTVEKKDIT